jgi:glycine cleavage system H protein
MLESTKSFKWTTEYILDDPHQPLKRGIMSTIPKDNLYTRDHEWVRIEGNKAEVGITDHAQKALGDIVFVELPDLEDEIESGDEFGSIESVKTVTSLFMPVSGRIIAVNTELKDSPELINEECYDEGWVIRLELSNPDESAELLSSKNYEEFLLDEEA